VPHDLLLEKIKRLFSGEPEIVTLLQKWIKAEVYDGDHIWRLDKGLPQGSVTSPTLANLFLDELDETFIDMGLKLVRYADDFLVLTKTEDKASEAFELTDMLLEELHLELNQLKTKIVSFDRGFKFLGAIFLNNDVYLPFGQKKQKGRPPKLPAPLNLQKYLELRG